MRLSTRLLHILGLVTLVTFVAGADDGQRPFTQDFNNIKTIASTVPANGDVNPYGMAVVPVTVGALKKGDVLVSNFNNFANLQGTGVTIDQIGANGDVTLFATLNAHSLHCTGRAREAWV